ncbi:MAG TPA: hypothetical protein ENO21_04740 [Firmicutes bacterium]|nr:hypothetical protein [Bacillota bacterium]
MKLRGWTILWTLLGAAAAGLACVWVLIQFQLLPVKHEQWFDMYTGKVEVRSYCLGIMYAKSRSRNFSAGFAPGGNLASYEDPQDREQWVKVSATDWLRNWSPQEGITFDQDIDVPWYLQLKFIALIIDNDPRPGFKYDPPNGYSKQAKKYLLLNCLQIARETRDARLIEEYYDLTVETLRPLDRKAYPDDLPDVDEFIASHAP